MANRLSARSASKVLVCEAGQDTPPGQEPPEIRDSYSGMAYFDPRFHWTELKVTTQVVSHNNPQESRPPLRKYEQARVLGGGSSINGQMANRGAPTDFAEWVNRGAEGWGWDDVLPFFKKVERDLDFDNQWHGKDGHISPCAASRSSTGPSTRAPSPRPASSRAWPSCSDQNGEFVDGYFPVTHSNASEQRVSAAMGYLGAETRKRANLTISTDTQVKSLILEGTRCVGVVALVKGKQTEFRANEVILSCGAIHSPAHLLRAGIGPVGHLKEMGIPVVSALEGVGQRLMDHPSISLSSFIRRGGRMNHHTRRHIQLGIRYSSGLPGIPRGDMFTAVVTYKSAWYAVGEQIASLLTFINRTYSETRQVKLASRDWRAPNLRSSSIFFSDRRGHRPADVRLPQDGSKLADDARPQGRRRHALPRLLHRQGTQDRRGQHQEQDPHRDRRPVPRRTAGLAQVHDRELRGRRLHLRPGHER